MLMVPRLRRDPGSGSAKPRLLLVDDHPGMLSRVSEALADDFDVVGTATDGRQALAVTHQLDPDAIVLDINMPGVDGFQTIRALKHENSRAAVVFLSIHDDPEHVSEAVRLGAHGYVLKSQMWRHLGNALDHALLGRQFLPSLSSWLGRNPRSGHAIHLHGSDASFADAAAAYFHEALQQGDATCLIASALIRRTVGQRLESRGWRFSPPSERDRYRAIDATEALNGFMRDGHPDARRLQAIVDELDDYRRTVTDGTDSRLVIAGCLAGALMAAGNVEGALEIERIWNDLTRDRPFLTACGYNLSCFQDGDRDRWSSISAEHAVVSHANEL